MYLQNLFLYFVLLFFYPAEGFKKEQMKNARVRQAYTDKESSALKLFKDKNLTLSKSTLYLRAFKEESVLELWAKDPSIDTFQLIKKYTICRISGDLGPKRQQGDLQIPEGYYHINRFNPVSNFYLSMGTNYPNTSDRILGVQGQLGGDIFIHGKCVTVGCTPITDPEIKELYVICVEAKNNGQEKIPVTSFPMYLNAYNYQKLQSMYAEDSDKLNLWSDLKAGYDYFEQNHQLFSVQFLKNGRHNIQK